MWVYIIFIVFIIAVFVIAIILKSKKSTNIIDDAFSGGSVNLRIKGPFMDSKETYYYDLLNRHLPSKFLIIPKVGVDNLLTSIGNKSQYDAISSKYVDFIIFEKTTMLPVVAIDLVEEKMSSNLTYFDKDVSNALKMVKIPIYTQYVEDFYVYDDLIAEMQAKIPALKPQEPKKDAEKQSEETNKDENKKDKDDKEEK